MMLNLRIDINMQIDNIWWFGHAVLCHAVLYNIFQMTNSRIKIKNDKLYINHMQTNTNVYKIHVIGNIHGIMEYKQMWYKTIQIQSLILFFSMLCPTLYPIKWLRLYLKIHVDYERTQTEPLTQKFRYTFFVKQNEWHFSDLKGTKAIWAPK